MKTSLLGVLLLTTTVCSAQPARTREITSGSWTQPNLSVETWDAPARIVAGTTEQNAGLWSPVFKFTDPNLGPVAAAPLPTYRTTFPTSKVLMDFTLNQAAGNIIMTGTDVPGTSTMNMYIAGISASTGTPFFSMELSIPGFSLIPHQIIYSPTNNHYVITGTKFAGVPTSANFATASKTGFCLVINSLTLASVNFIETNTFSPAGGNDSDMLECVAEIPAAQGGGYFLGGSANGVAIPGEQNMMVMRVVPGTWTPGVSCIMDNTTSRSAVSSVMFNPSSNQMIVMNNNSNSGTYELTRFNAAAVTLASNSFRHTLTCASGMVTNGFRLQQVSGGSQIIVGGYMWNPSGTPTLTPFQTTTNPGLSTMISAKLFQSSNSTPLTGYFNESGTSVFINTPDIITYFGAANRTYLVNGNSGQGFDMLRSVPTGVLACETGCSFAVGSTSWPVTMNAVTFIQSTPPFTALTATFGTRTLANSVLCSSTPLAPMPDDGFTEGTESPFKLFPNPAIDKLEIESEDIITELFVYDVNGSMVLSAENEQNVGVRVIDISMLKPGAYIVRLKTSNGDVQNGRFVKE